MLTRLKMNNSSCVSHLLIPDSDQVQIVVSRSSSGRGGATGTDIRVTALNRKATRNELNRSQTSPLVFTEIPPRIRGRSPTKVPAIRRSSASSGISSSPNGTSSLNVYETEESEKFEDFLRSNSSVVEDCISRCVDKELLERIVVNNLRSELDKEAFCVRWKLNPPSSIKRPSTKGLTVSVGTKLVEGTVRWQLAQFISSVVYADSFTLYLADKLQTNLRRFSAKSMKPETATTSITEAATVAAFVAKRRQALRIERTEAEQRFMDGVGDADQSTENSIFILCLPILSAHGEIAGVIELHRVQMSGSFTAEDEDVANSYLIWGGIAFYYADMNVVLSKQKRLNDFLLNVVKSIFQDMVSMDSVIKKVMKFAQKLVDADRASLFLLDNKTKELYARIFDLEWSNEVGQNIGEQEAPQATEIRFPLGQGIAGQVASTGNPLRVADAYEDVRFNSEVDKQTGYRTKSILCMPVFIKSTVIGVVQMVNKKSGEEFTRDDEEAFETFAVYCGLALHHAKLYDKIRRSEQKSKVAVEILSYHNTCSGSEFDLLKKNGLPQTVLGLDDYYFPPTSVDDMTKVHYSVYMFFDLFGQQRFDVDTLYRFCLTVKKNYRRVPYHNWNHGWTVANSMFCILKASNIFRPLECLALYIASLCHDLDHRGKNNKFLADTASPLASIYTTSTMEHHHFNQTVTILQQEGHNIFCQLSSDEYKQVLGNIKHCILATDLALFFPYKARLQELISKETYSWGLPDHRLLTQAIAMTAADLCASAKPWELQKETVKVIFAEFYEQGDYEKSMGRTPIPMMDRNQSDQQPACQVGFLNGICIPCYDTLFKLIPETIPLLEGCQKNLKQWQELAESQAKKKEEEASVQA